MPFTLQTPVDPVRWAKVSANAAAYADDAGDHLPAAAGPQALAIKDPRKKWEWIRSNKALNTQLAADITADFTAFFDDTMPSSGYQIGSFEYPDAIAPGDPWSLFGIVTTSIASGDPIVGWEVAVTFHADSDPTGPVVASTSGFTVYEPYEGGALTNFFQTATLDTSGLADGSYVTVVSFGGQDVSGFPVTVTTPAP